MKRSTRIEFRVALSFSGKTQDFEEIPPFSGHSVLIGTGLATFYQGLLVTRYHLVESSQQPFGPYVSLKFSGNLPKN